MTDQNESTANEPATEPAGRIEALVSLPDSPGHWECIVLGGKSTRWDVYFRDWRGAQHPFATNENQTDLCAWLTGKWRKISDYYQGRLAS